MLWKFMSRVQWSVPVLVAMFIASPSWSQLQITEVMINSVVEGTWEWIEVRNPTGLPLNMNNFVLDDDDNNALTTANIVGLGSGGMATNTVIPANGVGVLYNGTALGFNDQRFRNAWQLAANVPLVAVAGPPDLGNSGDRFGIWESLTSYNLDVADADMDGDFEVVQFTNSQASIDYTSGFPAGTDRSVYWNGMGGYMNGANWSASMAGTDGAVTSVMSSFTGPINSVIDVGNPGVIGPGTIPAGLVISEIMYNPNSSEPGWEWFEVVNNTGAAIDFAAAGGYTFDDSGGSALAGPNINSGNLAQGQIGIFYNSTAISLQNMQDAWGAGLNYIPVTSWQQLNNGPDAVALWSNFGQYQTDKTNGNFANATAVVQYDTNTGLGWPPSNNASSIHRSPIDGDPTVPGSWVSSAAGDGISSNAQVANATFTDHPGGDVGSPGTVHFMTALDGDFDNDGDYDCADINALSTAVATGGSVALFDLNGDNMLSLADMDDWRLEAGEARFGPGRAYRPGDANLDGVTDGSDFGIWNGNKFTPNTNYCSGNFNGDTVVDGSDFGIWNTDKFTSADGSVVPEPLAAGMALALAAVVLRTRRTARPT